MFYYFNNFDKYSRRLGLIWVCNVDRRQTRSSCSSLCALSELILTNSCKYCANLTSNARLLDIGIIFLLVVHFFANVYYDASYGPVQTHHTYTDSFQKIRQTNIPSCVAPPAIYGFTVITCYLDHTIKLYEVRLSSSCLPFCNRLFQPLLHTFEWQTPWLQLFHSLPVRIQEHCLYHPRSQA